MDANPNTFYVLDLDRTLVDTDKLYDILIDILKRETTVEISRLLHEARTKAEADGESFETVDYLRQMLAENYGKDAWLRVERSFIAQTKLEHTLEPGAEELLRQLESRHIPYGIITYGNEAWQLAKLEATGLIDIPYLVTQIKEKGRLLTGWKHAGGSFIIPPAMTRDFMPLIVDSIIFLDDKAVSFQDMPEGVQGIFVKSPTGKLLPSQRGSLPAGVMSVTGLTGAVELLFGLDKV